MSTINASNTIYGVMGAGSFGTAIANILAHNGNVLLYTRKQQAYDQIAQHRNNRQQTLHPNIQATMDISELCSRCTLIFPIIPAADFRQSMCAASPYLKPHHLLIHGTKGLNIVGKDSETDMQTNLTIGNIRTMSQIILEETAVLRVGCLSGPNLALNLAAQHPAATTIASRFKEVIEQGRKALHTPHFRVYNNTDIIGVELAGAFSKMTAIASGIVGGMGWGENTTAMLLTRALHEIMRLSKALGIENSAFLGLGGIGDMIAVAFSNKSRNYSVGYRLAKGESLAAILADMQETAEGISTVAIAKRLSNHYKVDTPIIDALHNVLFNNEPIANNIQALMQEELNKDIDFM
jgi:glycerol-3-phosphate dehydrogenase (NAD(P)+)